MFVLPRMQRDFTAAVSQVIHIAFSFVVILDNSAIIFLKGFFLPRLLCFEVLLILPVVLLEFLIIVIFFDVSSKFLLLISDR